MKDFDLLKLMIMNLVKRGRHKGGKLMAMRSPRKERKRATRTAVLVRKWKLLTVMRFGKPSQRVSKSTPNTALLREIFSNGCRRHVNILTQTLKALKKKQKTEKAMLNGRIIHHSLREKCLGQFYRFKGHIACHTCRTST